MAVSYQTYFLLTLLAIVVTGWCEPLLRGKWDNSWATQMIVLTILASVWLIAWTWTATHGR